MRLKKFVISCLFFVRVVKISNQLKNQSGSKCSVVKKAELSCSSTTEPNQGVSECQLRKLVISCFVTALLDFGVVLYFERFKLF